MQIENISVGKKGQIFGLVLIILVGLTLIASAVGMFAMFAFPHAPQRANNPPALGLDRGRSIFIAVLDIVSAVLFLVSWTRSLGLLLVSSYLGGAIATHLLNGVPIVFPAFVLSLSWLGTWLRHPQILWSLEGTTARMHAVVQGDKVSQQI